MAMILAVTVTSLAVTIGPGSSWVGATGTVSVSTYGYGLKRNGYNPSETSLGVANAASLHQLWSYDIGGATISEPMVAADVDISGNLHTLVLTGSENGTLFAVDAANGSLVWSRDLGSQTTACTDMPGGVYGVSSTVAIDPAASTAYVAGGDGNLYALDLASGATEAGWPQPVTTDPSQEYVYSAITESGGDLYVTTASYCDATPYQGKVEEFDISTHTLVRTWYVTGKSGPDGGGIWGQAGVAVDGGGHVYVATGNAMTSPEDYGKAEAVVRLDASLSVLSFNKPTLTGGDVDFGGSPMLFHRSGCPLELAVENKSGVLLLYKAKALGQGAIQRLQVGNVGDWQFNAIPAFDPVTDMLYVADSSGSGRYSEGLIAFQVRNTCLLNNVPVWQRPGGPGYWVSMSPPTVANGVVYYGDGSGDRLLAYNASTGKKLWGSGSLITDGIWAAPTVANGELFAGSWDGHLYAFGP